MSDNKTNGKTSGKKSLKKKKKIMRIVAGGSSCFDYDYWGRLYLSGKRNIKFCIR